MTYYRARNGRCPHCGASVSISYYHAGYGTWKCSMCRRVGPAHDFPRSGLVMKPGQYEIVRADLTLRHDGSSTIRYIDWQGGFTGTYDGPTFQSLEEAEKWCKDRQASHPWRIILDKEPPEKKKIKRKKGALSEKEGD